MDRHWLLVFLFWWYSGRSSCQATTSTTNDNTVPSRGRIVSWKETRDDVPRRMYSNCQSLYEWVDFIGDLDERTYSGVSQVGLIGSVSTPIFDNEQLQGNPVANLRGSVILDQRNFFATGTLSFYFYEEDDILTFHLGFNAAENAGSEANYGIPVGGTGGWAKYQGFIYNSRVSEPFESPYIVNYTLCSA